MMIVAHVVTTRSLTIRPFKVHVFSGALRSLQSNAKTLTQLMLLRNKRYALAVEGNTRTRNVIFSGSKSFLRFRL
ncbi:hypothetical protein V3C99_008092, partial [Haemonchus contortus]